MGVQDIEKDVLNTNWRQVYGAEAKILKMLSGLITNDNGQDIDCDVVVLDFETTGLSAEEDEIIEIGAVKIHKGMISETFETLVRPKERIPEDIVELTGITDKMVKNAPRIREVMPRLEAFCKGCVVVAHFADFDRAFFRANAVDKVLVEDLTFVDTFALAVLLMPELHRHRLVSVAKALGVKLVRAHRAMDDAKATAEIYLQFVKMMKEQGIATFSQAEAKMQEILKAVRKRPIRIEGSADKLREICNERARKLYGAILPEMVAKRLADELTLIVKNDFVDLYCVVVELIVRSGLKPHQYFARGSVGASFVAYLCGITGMVNPLPPHYRCQCASYTEFADDGKMVHELPDKFCPHCGRKLIKDGFGLAHQLFMGADGSRKPKFALDVSTRMQEKLMELVKVLPGVGDVIGAGVVNREKKTINAHPGGVILIPEGLGEAAKLMPTHRLDDGRLVTGIDYHDIWQFNMISIFRNELLDELEESPNQERALPSCFDDMVKIDGVARGMNAMICKAGPITSDADVYDYLCQHKVPGDKAFEIMDFVRAGCGIAPDDAKLLRKCGVPKVYIKSCHEVEYLFPRAQSIANVLLTCRVNAMKLYNMA